MRLPWEQQPEACSDVDDYQSHHKFNWTRIILEKLRQVSTLTKLQRYMEIAQIRAYSELSILKSLWRLTDAKKNKPTSQRLQCLFEFIFAKSHCCYV